MQNGESRVVGVYVLGWCGQGTLLGGRQGHTRFLGARANFESPKGSHASHKLGHHLLRHITVLALPSIAREGDSGPSDAEGQYRRACVGRALL